MAGSSEQPGPRSKLRLDYARVQPGQALPQDKRNEQAHCIDISAKSAHLGSAVARAEVQQAEPRPDAVGMVPHLAGTSLSVCPRACH